MIALSREFPILQDCFAQPMFVQYSSVCSMNIGRRGHYYCNIKASMPEGMSNVIQFHPNSSLTNQNVQAVEFFDSTLFTMPTFVCQAFLYLDYLYVNNTNLRIIPSDYSGCNNLRYLIASDNQVRRLEASTFLSYMKLEEIRLDGNLIMEVNQNAFATLARLRFLDLSRNNIQILHSAAFLPLQQLTQLNLSNNQLQIFEANWVNSNMSSLNLRNNQIRGFSSCSNLHVSLRNLRDLEMENNTCISRDFRFWGSDNIELVMHEFSGCEM